MLDAATAAESAPCATPSTHVCAAGHVVIVHATAAARSARCCSDMRHASLITG